MKKYAPIWISVVSLLLSVVAVCVAVWRSPELSFDYQGVIVGVLSLLVTVLIGWQICYFVFIRKEINKEVDKKLRELSHIQFNTADMIHISSCTSQILGCLKYNEWYKVILLYNEKIDFVCSLGEKEEAEKTVRGLNKLLANADLFDRKEMDEFKCLVEKSKNLSKLTESCFVFYSEATKKIQENHTCS